MYKLTNEKFGNFIVRLSDNTFIPPELDNSDYQVYLKWIEGWEHIEGDWIQTSPNGNTPEPADEITPDYRALRAAEYPSIGDQLDALFHAGMLPQELTIQIQAIKTKYPKS
jgi:hypothetical protein